MGAKSSPVTVVTPTDQGAFTFVVIAAISLAFLTVSFYTLATATPTATACYSIAFWPAFMVIATDKRARALTVCHTIFSFISLWLPAAVMVAAECRTNTVVVSAHKIAHTFFMSVTISLPFMTISYDILAATF